MAMLFDAHLHLFSRVYFEALAAQSPMPGSVADRLAHVVRAAGLELPDPDLGAHVRRWLADLDRHGVARAVAFASAPEEVDAVQEAARIAGGRLVPVAVHNPKAPGAVERATELLGARGFRGLLLFPALHLYSTSGPEMAAVARVADRQGAVLYVQCGLLKIPLRDALGFPRAVDLRYANPLDLVPVAGANRNATFVVPHFGAGFFREALMLTAQCENVLLDSSSSNAWRATDPAGLSLSDVFRRALGVVGAERLLFGTDSATFPRGWRRDLLDAQREALVAAGASPAAQERVLGGNAERLFAKRE